MTSSKLKPFQELHMHGGIIAVLLMRFYAPPGGWLVEFTSPAHGWKDRKMCVDHKLVNKMLRGCSVITRVPDNTLTDDELLAELGK